jgi:hypothetical protein
LLKSRVEILPRKLGGKRLVILPDGPLSGIPFEALVEGDPQSPLAGKAFVYAPSATVYLDRKARRHEAKSPRRL